MSKAKENLIKVNAKKGNLTLSAYIALLKNKEEGDLVYLDNAYADVEEYMTRKQWSGCLANLAKQGKYENFEDDYSGEWGFVH